MIKPNYDFSPLSSHRCPVLYRAHNETDTDILNLNLAQNTNAMIVTYFKCTLISLWANISNSGFKILSN